MSDTILQVEGLKKKYIIEKSFFGKEKSSVNAVDDISFSIKGIGSKKCSGERNIPDGEIYTAPVKDSVNGTITYNTPSVEQGIKFENVSLNFKDGKIISASANYAEKLNAISDEDFANLDFSHIHDFD